MKGCLWITVVLLASSSLIGSSDFLEKHPPVADAVQLLDVWIEEQRAYREIPGVSIGIVHNQELIWSKGYGFRDMDAQIPATPATMYRIASITKLFTATAIMQLRDTGKLRLDDPVSNYLPWFNVQSEFTDDPPITIRNLLTHTAGIPREAAFPYWTDHEFPTREEMIEALPTQDAVFAPSTTYKYSNLGMSILGEVVTNVSGKPWKDYVQENILEPLGMNSTKTVPATKDLDRMATAYMRLMPDGTRDIFEYYETNGIAPAANIASTVEDLARFASLQFRDQPAGGSQVLQGSTLREMHRPHWVYPSWTGGRGLGFGISRRNGKTTVSHGGWLGGNRSHLLLIPDEKIAVIVMVNADDASPYFFSYEAYDVVGPAIVEATAVKSEKKKTDPSWKKYIGDYVDPWGWEYKVMILDDGLVMYDYNYPPEEHAEDGLTRLTPVDKHMFRMSDGEHVVFEVDKKGNVIRVQRRYDFITPKK
ncbi:serine hydrolase domain-containing protein [Candidatus Neomarinimicrobiota bacterium]